MGNTMTLEVGRKYYESKILQEFGIHLGAPVPKFQGELLPFLYIPLEPHVFLASQLTLFQPINTPEAVKAVRMGDTLNNVMVMMAHGLTVTNSERSWVFLGTGKSVYKTVKAYESFARNYDSPFVDVVIACYTDRALRPASSTRETVPFEAVSFPYLVSGSSTVLRVNNNSPQFKPGVGALLEVESLWGGFFEWIRKRYPVRPKNIPGWAVRGI